MLSKTRIHEKTKNILIKPPISSPHNETHSLKQHIFDPSTNSPPNEFILNLQKRMSKFNQSTKIYVINDDSFDKE
jgi:hypothetical protein